MELSGAAPEPPLKSSRKLCDELASVKGLCCLIVRTHSVFFHDAPGLGAAAKAEPAANAKVNAVVFIVADVD